MSAHETLPEGFVVAKTRSKSLDWPSLFDGKWHTLKRGTVDEHRNGMADFTSYPAAFISNAKDRAREVGLNLEVATNPAQPNVICIKAVARDGNAPEAAASAPVETEVVVSAPKAKAVRKNAVAKSNAKAGNLKTGKAAEPVATPNRVSNLKVKISNNRKS